MRIHNLSSTVTIISNEGSRFGMGFFIDANHICTCAHVVSESMQLGDDSPEPPLGATVQLLLHSGSPKSATIEKWFPRLDSGTEGSEGIHDVAILKLITDARGEVTVPSFRECRACLVTSAYSNAHGHPRWSYNRTSPSSRGVVQLDVLESSGIAIAQGFSGAPVWDDSSGAVVGMINSRMCGSKIGYMMSIQSLVDHCGLPCQIKKIDADSVFNAGSHSLYDQLIEILEQDEWSEFSLLDAYERSLPLSSTKPYTNRIQADASPLPIVTALRRMVRSRDDTHPILAFVWCLIASADLRKCNSPGIYRLEKWFEEATSYFNCDAKTLQMMKERIENENQDPRILHLVFLLCESGAGEYEVKVYRVLVRETKRYWNHCDPLLMEIPGAMGTIDTLNHTLDSILKSQDLATDLLLANGNMIVELVVPDDVLVDPDWCPDQWVYAAARPPQSIGAKWHVVLRSWSRAYGPGAHVNYRDWQSQWSKADPRVGIVLRSVPILQSNGSCLPQELETVLSGEAEASVAIWPRQELHKAPKLAIEFDELDATPVDDWLEEVRRRRRVAFAQPAAEQLAGRCMTLYWDDPNKLLPIALGRARGREMERREGDE